MKKLLLVASAFLVLTGCASNGDYFAALDQANHRSAQIEQLRTEAAINRYAALAQLAQTGDETTRVAAVIALALGEQNGGGNAAGNRTFAPQVPQNEALEWARVLVPSLTTIGMGVIGHNTTRAQINANRDITMSSYSALEALGSKDPLVVETPRPMVVEQPAPIIIGPDGRVE